MYSKYNSSKCLCNQGHKHDSRKEAGRCNQLHFLQMAHEISELEVQKKYILIPAQRESSSEVYKRGPKKGQPKEGKVIEQECSYYADFDYIEKDGTHVVEDVKGYKDGQAYAMFKIKRKLMLYIHGIRIREI